MSHEPLKPLNEVLDNQSLGDVQDRISDMTSKVKDKAGQVAETVSGKLHQQRQHAADTLDRAASALHQNADKLPGGPKIAKATHSVAKGIDSTASYLRRRDFSGMGKDLLNVVRRYPTQSVVAALAVGFLAGRSRR